MAERKRPRRTRERILETSLDLFNRFGEPNITTADIADEMNISPGNLYYHFRNKDQIVEQLFGRFEARISIEPSARLEGPGAIEDLWFYLHLMFEAIWDYRFLYRNLDDLAGRNRRLISHFEDLSFRTVVARAAKLLLELSQAGTQPIDRRKHPNHQLAARIATVPEAFSRALKSFKTTGIVQATTRQILVDQPNRLEEISSSTPWIR